MSYRHTDWIQDVDMSVPGPAADHNGTSIKTGVSRHVVRVQNPRRVCPVPGCAHADAYKSIIVTMAQAKLHADYTFSVPTADDLKARRLAN